MGQSPPVISHHDSGSLEQGARSRVIAEPLPRVKDRGLVRPSQVPEGGEPGHPLLEIGDDRGHLGLLEHDLAHPDRIGRRRLTPRQRTAMQAVPRGEAGSQGRGELRGQSRILERLRSRPLATGSRQPGSFEQAGWRSISSHVVPYAARGRVGTRTPVSQRRNTLYRAEKPARLPCLLERAFLDEAPTRCEATLRPRLGTTSSGQVRENKPGRPKDSRALAGLLP